MSPEGDMMVGLIADPSKDGKALAAAYWDLSGEIDPSQPLLPSHVTPSGKRTDFFAARALKQRNSLWFTTQAYQGELRGCGEGNVTGLTKKYLEKVYIGNERITKIDELPDGRAEVGAGKDTLRCFELVGQTQIATTLPLHPTDIILNRSTDKDGEKYFRHDLSTGKETFLYKGSPFEQFQISARTGRPYAKLKLDFQDGAWRSLKSLAGKNGDITLEPALTTKIEDRYTMDILGEYEPGIYLVATDKFSDKVAVHLFDTETDTFSEEPLFAHPDFNILGIRRSSREEDFGRILGFSYGADVPRMFWIDEELKSIQDGLEVAFPAANVNISTYTDDRARVLFTVTSASRPPEHYLLLNKSEVAVIGSERPWLRDKPLGDTEFIYYAARDGMQIPALVTYPPNFNKITGKAKGAIIHPHGGPWARDYALFDNAGSVSYFAARGYIVLRPQYRGSAGLGRELWLAGDAEWGQKMQDDKDDAAAWLVEQGFVPADKIAIHGYSYGGFAAIAASVRPDSPYQCAIAGAGVANLTRLGNEWGDNRIQRVVQGQTVKGMDPMDNTEKINIPIQLYHGDYDVRVPLWHSTDFFNRIDERQPDSEMITLELMGHQGNKWRTEHKAQVLENMERFLITTCGM